MSSSRDHSSLIGVPGHRLAHVVGRAAPTESAAEQQLVDVALAHRQAGGFRRRGQRGFAILRRAPDLAAIGLDQRRRVHRLHRRVVLVGVAVNRLDPLRGTGDRGVHVAGLVVGERLLGVEAGREQFGDRCARDLRVVAAIPFDRDRVERRLRAPPGIGDHGDRRVADAHDLSYAGHGRGLRGVEGPDLAAEDRTIADRGVQHPGQAQVGAIDLLAGELVGGIQALERLADDRPLRRILQRNVGRRREPRRGGGDLAVARMAFRRSVRNDAPGDAALGDRHLPSLGSRLHEHDSRRRAALSNVVLRRADAAAAAGAELAPDALARDVLARRREFGHHLGPVALEFLGDHLGEAGQRSLPHLGTGDAHDDRVVGPDDDPGVDLVARRRGLRVVQPTERNPQSQRQPAAGRGGADQEAATVDLFGVDEHGPPRLRPAPQHGSPRAPAGRYRSGRCW
jgi:hypothetical protein